MKSIKKQLIYPVFACALLCMGVFGCASGTRQETETTAESTIENTAGTTSELPTENPSETEVTAVSTEATETSTEASTEGSTEMSTDAETDPAISPTEMPSEVPTEIPTEVPTEIPTEVPTEIPTEVPTEPAPPPTEAPTVPEVPPTEAPTQPVVPPKEVPTEPATQPPAIVSVWYTTSALNLREGPSLNHKILLTIPENTAVGCLEEGPVWSRVIFGETIGYVATGYLADEPLITFPGYGELAYSYVRYINDHFAFRLNGNNYGPEKKNACGNWIEKKMKSFGYTPTYYEGIAPVSGMPVKSYAFRKPCGLENARLVVIGAHYDSRESHGAEDNGTGVGMVLELAERFAAVPLPYDIDFCFWDGEEVQGCAGSFFYVNMSPDIGRVSLYINLDCLGVGDHLFAYGGAYQGNKLVRAEAYTKAMEIATRLGIPLRPIPAGLAEPELKTPTRLYGSDQYYFAAAGIPYLYFEANAWVDRNGVEQYPYGQRSYQYNSVHSAFADTYGMINHTKYDDLNVLEDIVPGRMQAHMSCFARILYTFLEEWN
ncbi:MAG: M28 family peptidase [Lachnospiraceae bacterium]|nr:M28 family peptidase [Lachnospiraceae bacterium]